MSSRPNYLLPVLPPVSCRHIFQNASNAAISVLISFQIEQALEKESETAMLRIRDGKTRSLEWFGEELE